MIEELKRPDRLDEDRIEAIKALFPEAFPDGRFNAQVLKELLEDPNEAASQDADFYGLNWPGKKQARKLSATPAKQTLAWVQGAGIDEDRPGNVLIEGDNLEVLKALLKSYSSRIDTIYIDPPYNTGLDFVYKDNYFQSGDDYLSQSGQADEIGNLISNPKQGGKYHANWLSMMYARLRVASELLSPSGLIFISIDDNEVDNLRLICDEIFGRENFVQQIVWKNKYNAGALSKGFSNIHEYILCYSKSTLENIEAPLTEEQISTYKQKDEKFATRGGFVTQPLMTNSKDDRPNLIYPIYHEGIEIWPEKQWIWSKERIEEAQRNNEVVVKDNDGKYSVRVKQYLRDEEGALRKTKPLSILTGPYNQDGTKEITDLLGKGVFDFPKPSELVKYLLSFSVNGRDGKDSIVLDFFAGSGTTAHAVMKLNSEDGGKRKFICVQIPEPVPQNSVASKAGFKTIADITQKRIAVAAQSLGTQRQQGFRSYRLSPSNLRKYRPVTAQNVAELGGLDFTGAGALIPDFKPQNVITEMMLLEGFPLDSKIEQAPEFDDQVYVVSHPERSHRLLISLTADKLLEATVEQASQYPKDTFICLESSLTDQSKIRLADAVAKVKTL